MRIIHHRDARTATATPEADPGCDRGQEALVMMGVNNIDRESPKHAGQFNDQQRIQHEKLAKVGPGAKCR